MDVKIKNNNMNRENSCPFLGLVEDPTTAMAFPSAGNCCNRTKPVALISPEHQRTYCLTNRYSTCPVFSREEGTPLPAEMRPILSDLSSERRPARRSFPLLIVLLVLVIIGIFIGWRMIGGSDERSAAETATALAAVSATGGSPLPLTASISSTPEPAPTDVLLTPTPTSRPTITSSAEPVCGYSLDVPIGDIRQFVIHNVAEGERLFLYATTHETTVEAIQAVNYYLPSPLWVGWNIVIPVRFTDVEGIPKLEAVFSTRDQTVDDFIQINKTDLADLKQFNLLSDNCKSFSGWLLVPRFGETAATATP